MGLEVEDGGTATLPLTLRGTRRSAADRVPAAGRLGAGQVGGAARRAAAAGATTVIEAEATRDHTERMLRHFGAEVTVAERDGGARASPCKGDAELAGRDVDGAGRSELGRLPGRGRADRAGLGDHHRRRAGQSDAHGLLHTLREMGADVAFRNEREEGGEPVADIRVRHSKLKGVRVPPERAPSMIDEYPMLACLAAFAEGETRMEGSPS